MNNYNEDNYINNYDNDNNVNNDDDFYNDDTIELEIVEKKGQKSS